MLYKILTFCCSLLLINAVSKAQISTPVDHNQGKQMDYGKPNSNAPKELSRFAFLVGDWQCDVKIRTPDNNWKSFEGEWTGRYILNGYVIADTFSMKDSSGKLVMLGTNFRTFNSDSSQWNMKWLEALSGSWLTLGPPDLGGVQFTDSTISYQIQYRPGELHRVTFRIISDQYFTWNVDVSWDNGSSWNTSMMKIKATRIDGP